MARLDGRRTDETREVVVKYEGLDRVDGSASFEFGEHWRDWLGPLTDPC